MSTVSLSDIRKVFERVTPAVVAGVADGRIAVTPEIGVGALDRVSDAGGEACRVARTVGWEWESAALDAGPMVARAGGGSSGCAG